MLPPISYVASQHRMPIKVGAGIVTNKGLDDVFLFGVEDDLAITSLSQLQAFSFCILGPGQSVDIEANPHIGYLKSSDKDKFITIHALNGIEVDVESNDIPTSWMNDSSHPWNGGQLPNGGYTDKFKSPVTSVNGVAGGGGAGGTNGMGGYHAGGVGGGNGGGSIPSNRIASNGILKVTLPKPSQGLHYTIKVIEPIEEIKFEITIDSGPKCTCGEKGNRHPGRCSSWCDLEKDKNYV